jgi:hypothetical protein
MSGWAGPTVAAGGASPLIQALSLSEVLLDSLAYLSAAGSVYGWRLQGFGVQAKVPGSHA